MGASETPTGPDLDDGERPGDAETFLRRLGALPDPEIDLGNAALALGSMDRPGVGMQRYRDHLHTLVEETRAALEGDALDDRVHALRRVIVERHGYHGDSLTYDDLQNANLLRVIDRRKGLPVALGILFLSTAHHLGWDMVGLSFPTHFLLRLDHGSARAILDPFTGARERTVPELREMLKSAVTPDAELTPAHYTPVKRRDILLRLQNNLKLRLLRSQELERASAVVERMLWIAPGTPELLREAAMLEAHLGNLQRAIARIEQYLELETGQQARHRMASLLQELRNRLN